MTTYDHDSDKVRGNKIIVWMQSSLDASPPDRTGSRRSPTAGP